MTSSPSVFLVDLANDHDRIQNDLKRHFEREFGAACPPADLTVERIGDLLNYDLSALLAGQRSVQFLRR